MQISLRLTSITDAEALLEIFKNSDVVKYTNFREFKDVDSLKTFLQRFLALNKDEPLQYGPYCILADNNIAGLCGLQQKNAEEGCSELWYILAKDFWGKGIAKEAVQLLIDEASNNSQLKTIYAEAVTANQSSWRILQHTGFTMIREIKDGFKKDPITENLCIYNLSVNV